MSASAVLQPQPELAPAHGKRQLIINFSTGHHDDWSPEKLDDLLSQCDGTPTIATIAVTSNLSYLLANVPSNVDLLVEAAQSLRRASGSSTCTIVGVVIDVEVPIALPLAYSLHECRLIGTTNRPGPYFWPYCVDGQFKEFIELHLY